MNVLRKTGAVLLALLFAVLLTSCNLPFVARSTPEPINEMATITPTELEENQPQLDIVKTDTAAPTETGPIGPPTAAPPELGETIELAPLPAGQELTIERIQMITSTAGWAVGGTESDRRRVLLTADAGSSWQEVTPPIRSSISDGAYRVLAVFLSPQRAHVFRYIPEPRGVEGGRELLAIWRTEDGGATWTASKPLAIPFIGVEGIEPYFEFGSDQVGWILARRGGVGMHQHPVALVKTEDAGRRWDVQHGPFDTPDPGLTGCTKSGMDFGSELLGVLTISDCPLEGAEILVTSDGGQTWRSVLLPAPTGFEAEYQQAAGGGCTSHSPQVLSATEWRVGVLCRLFENGDETRLAFLYWTEDSGSSWMTSEAPEGDLHFLSPENGWALGREIYRTLDGGESWQRQKEVFWDGQFSFIDMEQGWAVARSDDGEIALVRTEDGAQSWQIIEPLLR